jgi:ABC-type sugar transport system substrate-binding protein
MEDPTMSYERNVARRPRRFALPIGVLVVAVAALAAAGVSTSAPRKTPTVAFISQGTSNSWAAQLDAVARKTAKANGLNLVYFNGQGDATKQLPQIASAAAQHPDAIVLVPLGFAADVGPVERAMAAGIPVILCDSTIDSQKFTSLVNPNPATATVPLAEWLAKKMGGKGNLLYIGGLPGNATTILYDQGFNKVMKKYPDIKIVNGGNASYSISTAKQLTATALAKGTKFDGTWGVGGEAATGILQAYADAKIPIPPNAGAAATNGSLRLAIENKVEAAMLQFPPADSKVCIETAAKVIKGQKVPKIINISALPQYGSIFPPLKRYYKPQYSDDLYVGTDAVLSKSELAAIHLTK